MKIILDIIYNRQLIDAREIVATRRGNTTPTVEVDVTSLIDNIIANKIKRHAAKLAKQIEPAKLLANKTPSRKPKPKGMIKP